MRDALRAQLVSMEGLRLKPYRCPAGKLTIGVGRNLDDRGVTREEALVLLDNDLALVEAQARAAFPWFDALDAVRQDVVLNMCFNLGLPRLLGFRKCLAALAAGHYGNAAYEMMQSQWAQQVGHRAQTLATMMETGVYP
jgi:lysozyme